MARDEYGTIVILRVYDGAARRSLLYTNFMNKRRLDEITEAVPARRPSTTVWAGVGSGANAGPTAGVGDLDASLSQADFEAFFVDPTGGADASSPSPAPTPLRGRPATVVESINREFTANPVDAVRRNVNFHIDSRTLDAIAPEVREIADSHERQARVADALWDNPEFVFIKLVQGFTMDNSLIDRELEGGGRGPVLIQPGPLADIGPPQLDRTAPAPNVTLPFVPNLPSNETGYQRLRRRPEGPTYQGQREYVRVMENVDRLMAQPQVSGELQMSSVMFGAVEQALLQLFLTNKGKYGGRERGHFYRDRAVMVLFAKLVASIIIMNKMPSDGQYHQSVVEPRRKAVIAFWIDQLDKSCTWDNSAKFFRAAVDRETTATVAAKRQRFLDAYNPTTWFGTDD